MNQPMQYHFVICYDALTKKWHVEDETKYLDGNVWDDVNEEWFWPEDGSEQDDQNTKCYNMIQALVPIWPMP